MLLINVLPYGIAMFHSWPTPSMVFLLKMVIFLFAKGQSSKAVPGPGAGITLEIPHEMDMRRQGK